MLGRIAVSLVRSGGDTLGGHGLAVDLHLGGGAVTDDLDGLSLKPGIDPPGLVTVPNGALGADEAVDAAAAPALVMFAAEAFGAVGLGAARDLAVQVREALAAPAAGRVVVVLVVGGGGGRLDVAVSR